MQTKKKFSPETFIPMPARVASIVQLCLAFTLFAWQGSLPFMGELFATKYKMLIYQHVMGKKMESHAERFAALPTKEQAQILHEYDLLQRGLSTSFLSKAKCAGSKLWALPLLKKGWIAFSILIPILLLKRVEGALQIVWILPLLTSAYAVENRMQGLPATLTAEERLFPSEEIILRDFIKEAPKPSIIELQKQLQKGWEIYLIKEWTRENPSDDPQFYKQQVEKGDFAFNLARLKTLKQAPTWGHKQEPISLLALYLFWNLFFAFIVNKTLRQEPKLATVSSSRATPSCMTRSG